MKKTFLTLGIVALLLCMVVSISLAGTTVINVQTEGAGEINKNGGATNLKGAMVWNGTEWVVNNTYAHQFFIDVRTGDRLKEYNAHNVAQGAVDAQALAAWEQYKEDMDAFKPVLDQYNADLEVYNNAVDAWNALSNAEKTAHPELNPGNPPTAPTPPSPPPLGYDPVTTTEYFQGYTIQKQAYSYAMSAADPSDKTMYVYQAVEYVITDPAGKTVVLKSRGSGNGTDAGYFNVYVDDETGGSTAMRGDPVWFTYNQNAANSKNVTSSTQGLTGYLPGVNKNAGDFTGDYYMDIGGGADLGPAGYGKSCEMHCAPLNPKTWTLGGNSSFVTNFELKWMDASGNLQKITIKPSLIQEVIVPPPDRKSVV